MILIISEEKDASTNGVISWIRHSGYKFIRINLETNIEFIDLRFSDYENVQFRLKKNDTEWISFSDITSVWYRRGEIIPSNFRFKHILDEKPLTNEIKKKIVSQLSNERNKLIQFIYLMLSEKPSLGNFFTGEVNKLLSLHNAKKAGLMIPASLITTSKEELINFHKTNGELITKSIAEALYFTIESDYYCNYTEVVSKEFMNNVSTRFFPSLVQSKIDKAYELRIFYLNGHCYSMAIFSQGDMQTAVDFRKYNDQKPNRTVPYALPESITGKLHSFMQSMNLNSGSIDMIVTKNKEYVFLEVNPVGQFGMVSGPCNYNLEKKIADFLIYISQN